MIFPEMEQLEALLSRSWASKPETRELCRVSFQEKGKERQFPVYGLSMGSQDPSAPVLAFVGGVHGLERIGSQVVLTYLETLLEMLEWNTSLQRQLESIRIVWIPILNPIGMYLGRRSNANGVDLMRNSPVESEQALPFFGGQRISKQLPYYQGAEGSGFEPELIAARDYIREKCFDSQCSLVLDVHSGFGGIDRVWFPYARQHTPFPHLPEVMTLLKRFNGAYPNHNYCFEPVSQSYCLKGDFWDYLYDEFYELKARQSHVFMPLTLELGSWMWVKKNPMQIFSFLGPFNPIMPHRKKRVLRRHLILLDFLKDAVESHLGWTRLSPETRNAELQAGVQKWYSSRS